MANISQRELKFLITYYHDTSKAKEVEKVLQNIGTRAEKTGIDIKKLAERALVTIPVWYAVRTALNAVLDTMRSGAKQIEEMDYALTRASIMIKNVGDSAVFIDRLRETFSRLEKETGRDVTELSRTYEVLNKGLQDSGLAESVLSDAIKVSLVTMGDSGQIAESMVRAYKLMGDTMEGVTTEQDKLRFSAAIMAKLYEDTSGSADEFMGALEGIAAKGKMAGLTWNQLIVLLKASGDAMMLNTTGGVSLSRAFLSLIKNTEKLENTIGQIEPGTPVFEILLRTLKEISTLDTATQAQKLMDIFGIRGANAAAILGVINEKLKEMGSYKASDIIAETEGQAKKLEESIKIRLARIKELKEDIGEAFIVGIMGASDFNSALEGIVKLMENINNWAVRIGEAVAVWAPVLASIKGGPIGIGLGFGVGGVNYASIMVEKRAKGRKEYADYMSRAVTGQLSREETQTLRNQLEEERKLSEKTGLPIREIGNRPETIGLNRLRVIEQLDKVLAGTVTKEEKVVGLEKIKVTQAEALVAQKENQRMTDKDMLVMADRMGTLGYNQIEIEKLKYYILDRYSQDENAVFEQARKVIAATNEEIIKLSDTLKDAFSSGIEALLKNESTFTQFFQNLGTTIRDTFTKQVAGGLTESIFKTTGIGELFGVSMFNIKSMFGGVGGKIEGAFESGAQTVYNAIVSGFKDATTGTTSYYGGSGQANSLFASVGGMGGTLPGFGAGGFWNQPLYNRTPQLTPQEQLMGMPSAGGQGYKASGLTRGQGAGLVATSALTGYSAYQAARAGGIPQGQAVASGAMTGIGGLGLGVTMLAGVTGPAGWIFLGMMAMGMALGMFGGKKSSQTSVEMRTQENRISSKIDISNKQLEYVNRNLVALRATVETYMLPQSAYFATKRNLLEDEFALSSIRGWSGG